MVESTWAVGAWQPRPSPGGGPRVRVAQARPGYQSEILEADEDVLAAIALEFKKYGYDVLGAADEGIFAQKSKTRAEMLVAGTINHLECEPSATYEDLAECPIAVAWEVLDNRTNKVAYKVLSRYRREVALGDDVIGGELDELVNGTIHSLLSRPRFRELMQRDGGAPGVTKVPARDTAEYAVCSAPELSLPDDMPKAMGATVMIRAGDGVGSRFYISPDGVLLTAAHVVEGLSTVTVQVEYCDIMGYAGEFGTTNFAADPLFVEPGLVWRLAAGSPCIDAGTTTGAPTTDRYGRAHDASPDLGALDCMPGE
ncbi:MAG: hypothetical protein JW751_25005 [Polyangiaceae bacterium]|nr:hypothetical protein [Polyangiaceae bacterium]